MTVDQGASGPPYGAGAPNYDRSDDQALYDRLAGRPIENIPLVALAASKSLWNAACLLVGWSLRETTGTAPAQLEFTDGADATGELVAEVTIAAPLPGSVGNSDVDVDGSATGAAQANNVTLPGVAGATTFITDFEITGGGATGAQIITITLTGILGGTKTYTLFIPTGAGVTVVPFLIEFPRPIPASGLNTAIVVNVPSFGAGNLQAAVNAHGFQRTVGGVVSATGGISNQNLPGSGVLVKGGLFARMIAGSMQGAVYVRI